MPPRPFPLRLGIGTDIVHRKRIESLLLKPPPEARARNLDRYLSHIFSHRETQIFWQTFSSPQTLFSNDLQRLTNYLSGRWAAKEATIKACEWRRIGFKHVQILRQRQVREGESGGVYALILEKPASAFKISAGLDVNSSGELKEAKSPRSHAAQSGQEEAQFSGHNKLDQSVGFTYDKDVDFIPAGRQNDDLPGQVAKISISHDGEYTTAVCLAAEGQ